MRILPVFGIGQIDGVGDYVMSVLPELGARLGLCSTEQASMERLFKASLEACGKSLPRYMNEAFAPAIPEARELFDWLGTVLVRPDSRLIGAEHVARARALVESGANVLLVSNHTSGADHPATEYLINRELGGGATCSWIYMSGHVVNLFLIPLALSGGINRIQIFSQRYRSLAKECGDGNDAWMASRNRAAMFELARRTEQGGQLIVLYPEGGRGDGALLSGVAQTMKIPSIMSGRGAPLYVLPCYVDGATSILPVDRDEGEREFTKILCLARPGTVTVSFSSPIPWCELHPSADKLSELKAQSGNAGVYQYLLRRVMGAIASMAPTEAAKGPHSFSEVA